MATKSRNVKLEADVERLRSLQSWRKALDIVQQSKSSGLEPYGHLLNGEMLLEEYLRDNRPTESNVPKALASLREAESHLRNAVKTCSKDKETLKQEASMLLGKLLFVQARYEQALKEFDSIGLDDVTLSKVSNRMLRLVAEGFAVKGMCMEKLLKDDDPDYEKKEERIVKYYEQSGDILLLHLQSRDLDEVSASAGQGVTANDSSPTLVTDAIGSILELAVQNAPLVYMQNGQIEKGISRLRELLRAVETKATQNLRLTLARQLAEVLLRGVSTATYPEISLKAGDRSKKPVMAKQYSGSNLFVPTNEDEEALLILLIAECMANRNAVLERAPKHESTRLHSLHMATSIYDLLTILLVRRSKFSMLTESFERAMKFSFEEFHVWYQFALSLIQCRKYDRAYLVLKECHRLRPDDCTVMLLQAKLCLEHLQQFDDAIALAEEATKRAADHVTRSRAELAVGMAYSSKAAEARVSQQRQQLHSRALDAYKRSYELDDRSTEACFGLAFQLATMRKIPEALRFAQLTLRLQSDHQDALHLLCLLLSAEKKYQSAYDVINIALGEYPNTFSLLFTKSKLEDALGFNDEALATCKELLKLWKQDFESNLQQEEDKGTGLIDRLTGDDTSLLVRDFTNEAGSMKESIAALRVEQALSEVASSNQSSAFVRRGPQQSWALQSQIWLHLADIFLSSSRLSDAAVCVQEAAALFPLSHQVSYMKGRIMEAECNYSEAKVCYETALSINPYHIRSLQHLGRVLHLTGCSKLAEKTLRDAVNADPTSFMTWKELGVVLESTGDYEMAAECLLTAVTLEATAPLLPFSVIQRAL